MCGIAGLAAADPRTRLNPDVFEALHHRGPDSRGARSWSGGQSSWQLAFARLSIIDLSAAGEQPMANEDGSLVMVFNGEIYNSPELRQFCQSKGHNFSSAMDGEVILHLWEMEGAASLRRLNGIFALAIANTVTGEVVIARDPIGVKPLFYTIDKDQSLWFASELGALRRAGADLGEYDLTAMAQFLTFLWVPDPLTPFSEAKTLRPGRALRWTRDGTQEFAYGSSLVPEEDPRQLSPEAAISECHERLMEATHRQLLADVPIGLMASGGVDSGLLWWAAGEGLARAFTVSWTGDTGRERLDEDTAAVRELEQRFGTETEYLPGETAADVLPLSGDLFADPAYGLTRLIAQTANAGGYKVLLSGQGGDELFGGYRRHAMAPLLESIFLGPFGSAAERLLGLVGSERLGFEYMGRMAHASSLRDPFDRYMQLCSYSTAAQRAAALQCSEAQVTDAVVWQRHREVYDGLPHGLSFLRKLMAVDMSVYLPGLGLAYVDRAGMEFGIEIRVPWLDLDFVRWSLTLPDQIIMRRGRGKWLPRQLAAQELSTRLAQRPKRGFAAPANQLRLDGASIDGFRQGEYFRRAVRVLTNHRSKPDTTHPDAVPVRA